MTVQANPAGLSFAVDGTNYSSAQTFNWMPGSNHTIATTSPQSGGTGVQYVWSSWSDGGAISHTVTPTVSTNYTANFTTQYYLTMNAGAGGSVSSGKLLDEQRSGDEHQRHGVQRLQFHGLDGQRQPGRIRETTIRPRSP